MAAPTFVSETETSWSRQLLPTTKTTASVTYEAGDFLVALYAAEHGEMNITLSNSAGLTQTQHNLQDSGATSEAIAGVSSVAPVAGSSSTFTITKDIADYSLAFGVNVLRFSGSGGIGANAGTLNGGTGPSLNITTTQANSAIAVIVADWNAADGTSRTWRQVNGASPVEVTYFRDSAAVTIYAAYYADAGATGAKTVGLSAPTGQQPAMVALEVKGTAAAAIIPDLTMAPMRR